MKLKSESDIELLVRNDKEMMNVLRVARDFNLPNWWIGAGFLRNKVWDSLHDISEPDATDVDLVYFDKDNINPEIDWQYDKDLKKIQPGVNWEVKNLARMHHNNGDDDPYTSSENAIAHWPETATAIAIKLVDEDIKLLFSYGPSDLLNIIARPTPYFTSDKLPIFYDRIAKKQWQKRWLKLSVIDH